MLPPDTGALQFYEDGGRHQAHLELLACDANLARFLQPTSTNAAAWAARGQRGSMATAQPSPFYSRAGGWQPAAPNKQRMGRRRH